MTHDTHSSGGDSDLSARLVQEGETFVSIARSLFKDPRAASLLEDLNPEARQQRGALVAGQQLRVPSRAYAQRWAARMGITLGFDPASAGGTAKRRRWRAFAAPGAAPLQRSDEVALLAATRDFGRLLDEIEDLDTAGRGYEVWQMIARLGEDAVTRSIAQAPASTIDAIDGTGRRRIAVGEAIGARVAEVLARCAAEPLKRAADATDFTLRKPARLARLFLALADVERERAHDLLAALGLKAAGPAAAHLDQLRTAKRAVAGLASAPRAAQAEIEGLARQSGTSLEDPEVSGLLERAPTSGTARDRLAVHLAGLHPHSQALARSLRPLAKVFKGAAQAVEGGRHVGFVASVLSYVEAMASEQLGVTHQDSAAARALRQLLETEPAPPPQLLALAVRLPALLGRALVEVDAASLERGLAPVIEAGTRAATAGAAELGRMSAADLMARAASSAAQATERSVDAAQLGAAAALLVRASLLNRELRAGNPTQRKKRVSSAFHRRFTAATVLSRPPSADALEARVRDLLEWGVDTREVYSDVELRQRRAHDFLERHPEFFDQIAAQLPTPLPAAGRRRQSADGTALVVAVFLLDRSHALAKSAEPAIDALQAVIEVGGQVLEVCEQQLGALVAAGTDSGV